jgi:TPP-dependent pyruvate/acetoin dehydrogenase alpha subunit
MHLHHRESGFYGENAIVGGGLPWAAGAAWARRRRGGEDVAVAFLGDGAMAQGVTHEALLLARHWSSPTVFVCENNGFAHSMESERLFGPPGAIARRAAATGLESAYADGRDVADVAQAAEYLVAGARTKGRPAFLECAVYRVRPHSVSDADYRYRPKGAGDEWLAENDPLARAREAIGPARAAEVTRIDEETARTVKKAFSAAEAADQTPRENARTNVYTAWPS